MLPVTRPMGSPTKTPKKIKRKCHDEDIENKKRRIAGLRRRLEKLSLRQDHHGRRRRRLERIRRRVWFSRRRCCDPASVSARGGTECLSARADLCGALRGDAP